MLSRRERCGEPRGSGADDQHVERVAGADPGRTSNRVDRLTALLDGVPDQPHPAELTGDVTLVTLTVGEESLAVKMPKEFDIDFDIQVAIAFPLGRGFLFDAQSGQRLDARLATGTDP